MDKSFEEKGSWDAWGDEVESDFAMKPEGIEER